MASTTSIPARRMSARWARGAPSDEQIDPAWRAEEAKFNSMLGHRLAEERRRQGLAQHELASRLGMNCGRLQGIEQGKTKVSINEVQQLADALGVTTVSLLPVKEGR